MNCYRCEGKHLSQNCPIKDKECFFYHSLIIVDGKEPNLLGRDMLRVIKIDWSIYICKSRILNVNNTNLLDDILEKYPEVFVLELGKKKDVPVKISVPSETKPIFYKARSVPYYIKENVEDELERLV